ncbi:MAG: Rnf-Nqr domain containing protein [Victivallales bacterium]|nr:electron transport complex subunit RsxA [bacterium]MDD7750123.1 Rnf-Nqr domain containing protein [bacterium]MDY5697081.1 Rnf-Nqr domain containing protein [Victivallales bacterium]
MTLNEWLAITIGAILVNNMVLARILGICPFLGVSKKLSTALGMSGALIFVMTIASFVASVLYNCLLKVKLSVPALGLQNVDIGFTKLLLFIVVIAALVQIVEIVMQKFSPPLYAALGIYLPLITTNCCVLGAAELNSKFDRGILASTVFGLCSGVGFALAVVLFASIRERLAIAKIPRPFQGAAIALITAGILAMAFMGFSGLVR